MGKLLHWIAILQLVSSAFAYRYGSWYRTDAQRPVDVITDVVNNLGVKILQQYSSHGNVAFSPTGVAFVLAALYEGSAGRGSQQIAEAMGLPANRDVTRIGFRDIHRRLRTYLNADGFLGGLTLSKENTKLRPEYEEILRFYGFDLSSIEQEANVTVGPSGTTELPTSTVGGTSTPVGTTTGNATMNATMNATTTVMGVMTTLSSTATTISPSTVTSTAQQNVTMPADVGVQTTLTPGTSPGVTGSVPTQTVGTSSTATSGGSTQPPSTTTTVAGSPNVTTTTTTSSGLTSTSTDSQTSSSMVTTVVVTSSQTPTLATTTVGGTQTNGTTMSSTTSSVPMASSTSTQVPMDSAGTTTSVTADTGATTSTNAVSATPSTPMGSTNATVTNMSLGTSTTAAAIDTSTDAVAAASMVVVNAVPADTPVVVDVTSSTAISDSAIGVTSTASNNANITVPNPVTDSMMDNSVVSQSNAEMLITTTNGTAALVTAVNATTANTSVGEANDLNNSTLADDNQAAASLVDENTITMKRRKKSTEDEAKESESNPARGKTNDGIFVEDESTNSKSVNRHKRRARSPRGYFSSYPDEGIWMQDLDIWKSYPSTERSPSESPDGDSSMSEISFLVNGCDVSSVSASRYVAVLPFAYFPSLNAVALEFPLDDPRYNIILFMPTDRSDAHRLARDLSGKSLRLLRKQLQPTWVRATIPSFMLRGFVTLTSFLQRLGILDVFEPRVADLSPMTADLGVYATDVQQSIGVNIRNYMKPDRTHSRESSNVESPSIVPSRRDYYRYLPPGNGLFERAGPVPFTALHPFLYFIVDTETSVSLIAGRVDDPLNSRIL